MSLYVRQPFEYAYGVNPAVGPARVRTGNAASGAQTIIADGVLVAADGLSFQPFATNAPITIGVGANAETVTPSAVTNNADGSASVTATFSNTHGIGDTIISASNGSWEAANAATAAGINPLIDESVFVATYAIPNAQVLTLFSVGVLLVPAPGAGRMIDVESLVIENVFKTGAYAGGGAIQASYGTGVTNPATATIAATFLTSPTVNQVIKVAGALASTASSSILNTAVRLAAATADFTTGAGSLIVKLRYRVLVAM